MPSFLITNTGLAAFTAAGGLGPKVDISHFRVGANSIAEGYNPSVTDTDIPAIIVGNGIVNPQGYMPVVNYQVLDQNHVSYTLRMDQSIGTFNFGSVALYQESPPSSGTYVCVAVYSFGSRIMKQVQTLTDAGNVIEINATLSYLNAPNLTVTVNIVAPAPANMMELPSPDNLSLPSASPVNAYVLNGDNPLAQFGLDTDGNSIIAYKNDTDFWSFSTHLHDFYTGTVTACTSDVQFTDTALGTLLTTDFAIGKYILVVTSGPHKGVCRMITAVATDTVTWYTSTGANLAVGSTYVIYIANVAYAGGTTSGSNTYKLVTVTNPLGQTVFDTYPVLAEQMSCYFGGAFQPPTDYVISISDPYEITFSYAVPQTTRVHFIARTLDYNTVIPGGTAGQALIKQSASPGDYAWTTLTAGSNNYVKVTAGDSGDGYQYVFNIAPVYADSALVFTGGSFQPPEPTVYVNGPGVNQVTFQPGSGVPVGTDVFFVEKVSSYLGIIPGGTTNQVLLKQSSTPGDYIWGAAPGGTVPTPANPADDGKVLTANAGVYSWSALPAFAAISVDTTFTVGTGLTDYPTLADFIDDMQNYSINPGVTVTCNLTTDVTETKALVWRHPQSYQIALQLATQRIVTLTIPVDAPSVLPVAFGAGSKTGFYLPSDQVLRITGSTPAGLTFRTNFPSLQNSIAVFCGTLHAASFFPVIKAGAKAGGTLTENAFIFKGFRNYGRFTEVTSYYPVNVFTMARELNSPNNFLISESPGFAAELSHTTATNSGNIRILNSASVFLSKSHPQYWNIWFTNSSGSVSEDVNYATPNITTLPYRILYNSVVTIDAANVSYSCNVPGGTTTSYQAQFAQVWNSKLIYSGAIQNNWAIAVGSTIKSVLWEVIGSELIVGTDGNFYQTGQSAANHTVWYGGSGSTIKVYESVSYNPLTNITKSNLTASWGIGGQILCTF